MYREYESSSSHRTTNSELPLYSSEQEAREIELAVKQTKENDDSQSDHPPSDEDETRHRTIMDMSFSKRAPPPEENSSP